MRLLLIRFLCAILLLILPVHAGAQNLLGLVTNASDKPLEGVSVFIKEVSQGIVTAKDGRFQASLPEGQYTLSFDHLEYKPLEISVSLSAHTTAIKEIRLEKDTFHAIPFFSMSNRRDKAAAIMREVIRKAPVYANAVQKYKAQTYVKGLFEVEKVSDIVDELVYRIGRYRLSDIQHKLFFQEMSGELDYAYPDDYQLTVKAYSGELFDGFNHKVVLELLDGFVYGNKFYRVISPLNANAFSYYRYWYEGYYNKAGTIIHKIRVESKLRDPELMTGYLYVVDKDWAIDKLVLLNFFGGPDQTVTISYRRLGEQVYLPVNYLTNAYFSQLGTAGEAWFYVSLKYQEIVGRDARSEQQEIHALSRNMTIDSLANKQEPLFWDSIRTIPLSVSGQDIQLVDSIHLDKNRFHPSNFWIGRVLFGDYLCGDGSSRWSVRYSGVKHVFWDYNYVDGFWLGQRFTVKGQWSEDRSLDLQPYLYYATARERFLGGADLNYQYSRDRQGILSLSLGSKSVDFNNLTLTRYQNYFASLVYGENYNFFYQKDYGIVSNSFFLSDKLKAQVSAGIERRSGLENHTDFNIFGRDHITENIFPNDRFDRTFYSVGLSYSPFSSYSPASGMELLNKKIPLVFNLEYQEAFPAGMNNQSTYKKLKGGFIHNIGIDYFNRIDYKVEGGVFLHRGRNMHFADYQHFGASDLLIDLNSLFDSFMLLGNYEYPTNRYWVNVFLNYSGKYVLLKYLPFLQGKPFTENFHLKTLFTPDIDSYVELGYSIAVTRRIGIGGYISFNNLRMKDIGARFSLNLGSLGL